MGKKKQQYPTYKRGDLVRLVKDKMRYPMVKGEELPPTVFVPSGEVGTVSHHITEAHVIVIFGGDYAHADGLALNVISELEAV